MNTFLERLIDEKKELDAKRAALRTFIESEAFTKIDDVQMTLLNIQIKAMDAYAQVLLERIVRLQ